MADQIPCQVSLVSGNSGTVSIVNCAVNIICNKSDGKEQTSVGSGIGGEASTPTDSKQRFFDETGEVHEDVTWLQRGKLLMFHNRPVRIGSDVYYGKQILPGNSRDVAIKLIRYDQKLMKDVHFLVKLKHPNIVQFIDAGEYQALGRRIYIVMELCEKNLQEYVEEFKNKPVESETFAAIFEQLVEVLDFLKLNNVLHRDIKPDNILITADGVAKLADFGISRDIPQGCCDVTLTSSGVGSDGYRSPEMYEEGARISSSSDVFSLGLVACFLFSKGKHPFGSDPFSWSYKIRNNKKLDLSILKGTGDLKSRQLIQLVKSMLQHNPRDRPTTNQIKEHPFFEKDRDNEIRKPKRSLLKLFRSWKEETSSEVLLPKDINFDDLKLQKLLCFGLKSKFYKGTWNDMTVCVEAAISHRPKSSSKQYLTAKQRVLSELQHRNLIRLFAKTIDKPFAIVLEFVGNRTLTSYLMQQKDSLTVEDRLKFSAQIADAMNYMSKKNYAHGSLCADGILVGDNAVLKISRFHNTKRLNNEGEADAEFVDVRSSAPEVLISKILTKKSDVWSFGVVLYEIFSNATLPYEDICFNKILEEVSSGYRLEQPKYCTKSLYQKMQECWEADPDKRPDFSNLMAFFRDADETDRVPVTSN